MPLIVTRRGSISSLRQVMQAGAATLVCCMRVTCRPLQPAKTSAHPQLTLGSRAALKEAVKYSSMSAAASSLPAAMQAGPTGQAGFRTHYWSQVSSTVRWCKAAALDWQEHWA